MARRHLTVLLLVAACAQTQRSGYVPGREDLPGSVRSDYRLAVTLEYQSKRKEALEVLDELTVRYPLRVAFHMRRLRLDRLLNGAEHAAGLYDPPPPGLGAERAGIFASLARLPETELAERRDVLTFAAQREPEEPWWRLALGDLELSAHEIVKAKSERERELGRVESADETRAESAAILDRAREEVESALALDPRLAEGETMLGYILTRKADLAGAIESRDEARREGGKHYVKALEIDPEHLPALLNLAENEIYFDRYSEAVELLQVAVKLAPAEPLVWNNLGYSYYAGGRLSQAQACYEKALGLDPGDARLRTAYADTLRRLDKPDDAVGELNRARDDAGDDRVLRAQIVFKLAAIHEHLERYREAIREYERYIELGGKDSAKARSRIRQIYRHAFE